MTVVPAAARGRGWPPDWGRLAGGIVWLTAALLVGLALPLVLADQTGSLVSLAIIGLVAGIGLVVFAFARPEALFVVAFVLLAVVRTNPAPVDLIFALLVVSTLSRGRPFARVPPLIGVGLVLFGILSIASTINALDGRRALVFGSTTVYLIVLALWLTGMFENAALTRRALKAYVLVAVASAIIGILALEVPFPGRALFLYDSQRPMALFKDPNVFGPFLVPAAAIMLEELIRPRLLGWNARRSFLAFATLSAGVVFSFSRAGWLNLGIAIAVVVCVYAGRKRGLAATARSIGAIALCALLGIGLLVSTGSLSFLESRSHLINYDTQRFAAQSTALEHASTHVLGFGPGQSEVELNISTHSLYARVGYEQGLLGLALMIGILGATLLVAVELVARDSDLHGLGSAALLASWIGLLANSFFVDTLHWRHLWVVAAFIWCASALSAQAGLPAGKLRPAIAAITNSGSRSSSTS